MDSSIIIGIAGLLLTIFGFVVMWFQGIIKTRERIITLETKIEIFWRSVAFDAAKILHTPHLINKKRDELLEKFVEGKIIREELKELILILKQIIEEKNRDFGERTAASQLLRAIE